MNKKKLLALVLALVMLLGLLPVTAAAEGEDGGTGPASSNPVYATNIEYKSALGNGSTYQADLIFVPGVFKYTFQVEYSTDELTFYVSEDLPGDSFSEIIVTDDATGAILVTKTTMLKKGPNTSLTAADKTSFKHTIDDLKINAGTNATAIWRIGKKDTDTNGDNKVNNKDEFTQIYETYTLHINHVPAIGWLEVFDNSGNKLTLSPSSTMQYGVVPFVREYTTATTSEIIRITAHGGMPNMAGTNNYAEVWINKDYTGTTINMDMVIQTLRAV